MASMHQVLQVQQRFGDDQDTLASLAPNFQKVNNGQAGPPVTFQVEAGGKDAFALIQGYDLDKVGLKVLLDGQVVGTLSRGSNSGWSTFILPLPDLNKGEHKLQFVPGDAPDNSLIATAIVQWSPSDAPIQNPFPDDAETVVFRGWVNLDLQRQLGGSPDGDTLWLLDAEVEEDIRGIGAAVLTNKKVNKERQHAMGVVKRLPIRFQGIDTPEIHALGSRQNYGFLALAKLEEIGGRRFLGQRTELAVQLRCSVHKDTILDPNDRVLGYVTLDGLNVNAEMVRLGYAFPFLYDSVSLAMQQRLREYASAASTAEAGVWREYASIPVEPLPEVKQPFADFGPVNFPTFWRRWAEFRKSGGLGGPRFVEWLKANKDKRLAAAPHGAKVFSDLIDPSSNRLLVKPWEIVFEE
ncbi:thermonuclease family protein [Coleofasciculus sp. FACHB-129]|uniref:thermonuclease family protein n=1 Tax=Cyanophyceae TaxID=3028117 RepID=UPI001682160F|nr:thermonuclease family protein [Coleofasciculus sp. FACHB-129]MBD1895505.1 thermonuclease family protein [Coleofasciculus sp. FACHB-129]